MLYHVVCSKWIKLNQQKLKKNITKFVEYVTLFMTISAASHPHSISWTIKWIQFDMHRWNMSFSSDKSILFAYASSHFSFSLASNCSTVSTQYSAVVKMPHKRTISSREYRGCSPSFNKFCKTFPAAVDRFWKSFVNIDILVPEITKYYTHCEQFWINLLSHLLTQWCSLDRGLWYFLLQNFASIFT